MAAGAGPVRVLYRHVLPHLAPVVLIQAAGEVAGSMWLFGQLGVANVFLGGTEQIQDDIWGESHGDFLGEWGGILAQGRSFLFSAPWMVFGPALCFGLAGVGFHLLAEGLRRRYEQRWGGGYIG